MKIESLVLGENTNKVKNNLNLGLTIFIVIEILGFISLFFAYFYISYIPSIELGSIWPPLNNWIVYAYSLPLLNTCLLISSSITATIFHNLYNYNKKGIIYLILTIILGILFIFIQIIEYYLSPFTISDSSYGSIFYILTGWHGIHVILGICFLIYTLYNYLNSSTSSWLIFSLLYWHLVDIIWIVLYIIIYSY